ncbi:MAG TPA: hypothetical protein VH062_24300 [Polyangiaceae bacterium]|nr:hypothetical protein [Polyangiaceae bacterium]
MIRRCLACVSAAWLLSACTEDQSGKRASDTDAGTADDGGTDMDAGDPNGTMDKATPLVMGDFPGVFDSLDGREDIDFFSFQGTEGEWVSIRTIDKSETNLSDTPLSLYGPDRVKLAANRYAQSLLGEDLLSRIVTRLPATGTFYVGVADPGAPSVSWGLTQPYRISVVDADLTDGYTVNAEGADPTPSRLAMISTPGGQLDDVFVSGTYDADDDSDAFVLDIKDDGARLADVKVDTSGKTGNGSTTTPGAVWVTDLSGATVIGKIDGASGQTSLTPPLDPGKYLLWTSHPSAPLGANDFYVLRALIAPDNPAESEDETNGVIAKAEPLVVDTLDAAGSQLQAFVLLHVGDGDVDYFRFDGKSGQTAQVSCVSRGDGSGVVGLAVSARNEKDESLADAVEDPATGLELSSLTIPSSGKLYLRITKDSQLPDVTGDWARCVIGATGLPATSD